MWPNPQKTADLIIVTEEILNGKLHFLCSVWETEDFTKKYTSIYNNMSNHEYYRFGR